MDYTAVVDYFEGIASKLKKVAHHKKNSARFIVDFNDEVTQKWGSMKGFFIVLSEGAGRFVEQNPYFKDSKRIAIEIHGHCSNLQSVEDKTKVRSEVEALAKQIIAKMIDDSEDYSNCPHFMQRFNASSAIYEHFESMVPNFLTCVLSFDIVDEDYIEIDEKEWL